MGTQLRAQNKIKTTFLKIFVKFYDKNQKAYKMNSLTAYNSDSSSEDSSGDEDDLKKSVKIDETNLHLKKPVASTSTFSTSTALVSAPTVQPNETMDSRNHVDPGTKELAYNPKFDELFAPVVGPVNPHKSQQEAATKNTLAGYVEPAHVNNFQFELERKTFHSYGFAHDPSQDNPGNKMITNQEDGLNDKFEKKTVFEAVKERPRDKRKRDKNDDPTDIEGFLGPWGKYTDDAGPAKPSGEDAEYLEEYLSKMKKRAKKTQEETPMEEKSTLHIKDAYDYQGRSFLHIPQDLGANLKSDVPPEKCFIPKRQIHEWKGHSKGVAAIRWFPKSGHLILSGAMDSKVKIWEVYRNRRCIRTYSGHRQAIRDVNFNNSGDRFLSTSYDRYIKLWDTETGKCVQSFTSNKVGYCCKFNPDEDKQHLFVTGMADKKILCWDIRSGEIVQVYDRHLGAVNSITFVDENRRFVSTSDDKSLRVWEWDIPVDMKYIADPSMHSMPTVAKSPNEKWLAAQSLDNKICIFTCGEKFKPYKKKEFKGHMVAGYACGLDFSPEMSYIISGDGDGKVCIWDWKTTRMMAKWKAHDKACVAAIWHPHETSKVATASWDNSVKYWD